jgi:hypothetical protein
MLYVIAIAVFVYILSNITRFDTDTNEITALIRETHQYSGIHEESYGLFYANMQLAMQHKSEVFLDKALHHLNEIPLYMSPIDPDVQAEVAALGQEIAVATERVIVKDAMNTKKNYRPKYI